MAKLRKQRRKKVYRHNVNRKRMRNKLHKVENIQCKQVKDAWDRNKSTKVNLKEMGLSYDPNETIKIPNAKKQLKLKVITRTDEWTEEEIEDRVEVAKNYIAEELEKDAKAPRVKLFRLPKGQVEWISYLIDKYESDYKAMARDKRNYNQETWKQLRAKIKRFKSIPEQYSEFLKNRNLSNSYKEADVVCDSESD
ncbi:hypothetical protein AMK59_4960 [Oryctes borbonicus]|uniref:Nucleolar protein 16 n=1 Tax=Oryctes borbonicus TaxID=1629725 RepID=A0A0T6B199_9SCAR|nr:hypothetical protein AMK59_4960 [Oryctes borbonicus]